MNTNKLIVLPSFCTFQHPCWMSRNFDLNQELVQLSYDECFFEMEFEGHVLTGLYFAHRLGSRVPLFLFVHCCETIKDFYRLTESTLQYFCKVGNMLSIGYNSNFDAELYFLLRNFGSIYTIVFSFEEYIFKQLTMLISGSPFLRSEVKTIVSLMENQVVLHFLELGQQSLQKMNIPLSVENSINFRNAKILESLQLTLQDECLEWTWQFDQSDKLFLRDNLVMKNLDKWKVTDPIGLIVLGTPFIPMKLMHDADPLHCPSKVLASFPAVGLIIDLSNDEGSYDKTYLLAQNVAYQRLQIASKQVPSSKDISNFIDISKAFISKHPNRNIIVHCHYGYNRTGIMICAYMIEVLKISVPEALERFKSSRPPGIKHQNYVDKLYLRYENTKGEYK